MPSAQRLTLAGALALAVVWLVWPAPDGSESVTAPSTEAAPTVWETWELTPRDWPGAIEGLAWEPVSFLEGEAALGTDESGRLLYVEGGAEPAATVIADPGAVPGVVAAAANEEHLAWLESTPDESGRVLSELWIADRGESGTPGGARLLSGDTGDVVLAGGAYDLQFAEGALHWLATARSAERVTEHRSVRVDGGEVTVTEHAGAWRAAEWPWLASAGSDSLGGAELRRADDGAAVPVEAGADELALCSARWCRLIVTAADGSRIDLVHPDGTERVTVAEGFASAVAADVGLLDRFEPLEESTGELGDSQRVTLFDLAEGERYLVAPAAGETGADARHLWWSTGAGELREWHVLDLTDLA